MADYIRPWESHPTGDTRGTTQGGCCGEAAHFPRGLRLPIPQREGAEQLIFRGLPTRRPPPAPPGCERAPGDGTSCPREAGSVVCWSHRNSRTRPTGDPPPPRAPGWEERTRQPTRERVSLLLNRTVAAVNSHVAKQTFRWHRHRRCSLHSCNHCPVNWQIQSKHSSLIKKGKGDIPTIAKQSRHNAQLSRTAIKN